MFIQKLTPAQRRDARLMALRVHLAGMGQDPEQIIQTARGDALSVSLAFARELEYIEKTFLEYEFPDLRARDLIPLGSGVPSWAQTFSYREMKPIGEAAIVHDYSNDFPRVDLDVGETTAAPIIGIGCSFGYSVMDLRYASQLGMSLDTEKMRIAKEAEERKLDALACYGHAPTGLRGFATNTTVQTLSTALNSTMAKNWATRTAVQITDDIDLLINSVGDASDNKFTLDTIAAPVNIINLLGSKRFAALDSQGIALSVLDYLSSRKANKVNFEPWFRLKAAGPGGIPRIVAYKKDPSVLRLVVPQDFESSPPERKGFTFEVACHMRFGGVDIRQPMAMRYIDNPLAAP